jgi:hypothetical protein
MGDLKLKSLCVYRRRMRLNESIHLVGFTAFTILAASKFASQSLTAFGPTVALVLNLILGLWPVVLQRYNRLRLYRAIHRRLSLPLADSRLQTAHRYSCGEIERST